MCPDCGGKVEEVEEESYFLNVGKYAPRLIEYIETHPEFIQPASRAKEMLNNFLLPGLEDLCVSRNTFKWGVPVSFDDRHVIYVWFDAVLNYLKEHQVSKVTGAVSGLKDSIMGTASDVGSSASDTMSTVAGAPSSAKHAVRRQTRGNPLAAGAAALAAGWLLGSLLPASQKEAEAAAALKEKAAPLVEEAKAAVQETAANLKDPAAEAVASLKESATSAVESVKDHASESAATIKSSATDSAQTVKDAATE